MQTLEQDPSLTNKLEQKRSFEPLASVNLMRYDLESFGQILPETRERVFDEELTYVAEGINLPLKTEFEIKEIDGELQYFHKGEWRPYISMLEKGVEASRSEAAQDSRKEFLVAWVERDLEIGKQFSTLAPNESLEWYSTYPYEEEARSGAEFIEKEAGLQPRRSMGFLYRAYKNDEGQLFLQSHSVDNSDLNAFEAAIYHARFDSFSDMDSMVEAYDQKLGEKYGNAYSAGRLTGGQEETNAWDVIQKNKNLVSWYFENLESLALSNRSMKDLKKDKDHLTLEFWSALKKRIEKNESCPSISFDRLDATVDETMIRNEAMDAYRHFRSKGEVLVGCGGGTSFDMDSLSSSDAIDLIFGGGSKLSVGSDKYGSLSFRCQRGHLNTRPHGKLIECCKTCGVDVKC